VYDNIRKFLQFQLTVNVVGVGISLIAAFLPKFETPLRPVQLMWVNLIMDSMAALALATETPTRKLLTRHPFVKGGNLLTQIIWRFVLGHALFQIFVLIGTMYLMKDPLDIRDGTAKNPDKYIEDGRNIVHLSIIFNLFVWMQVFNEINARRVNNEWNVFDRFFDNSYFLWIMGITSVVQVVIVEFGGLFMGTTPLTWQQWLYCIGVGALSLPINQVIRLIPVNLNDGVLRIDTDKEFKRDLPDIDDHIVKNALEVVTATAS